MRCRNEQSKFVNHATQSIGITQNIIPNSPDHGSYRGIGSVFDPADKLAVSIWPHLAAFMAAI